MSTHRQHPSRAQQPTSAPPGAASSSASDHKPLKWAFPFTPSDKADASDPMTYMKALAAAEDGFYPLGSSGIWHGGVHFDQGTAKLLKQGDGIRAIADGEVVAYRLDSKYPEQVYQDGRQALYSTGFVLIRHKLQLPPAPPKPAPANPQGASHGQSAPNSSGAPAPVQPASSTHAATPSAAARPSPDETLTFFSLYMHLMDWNSYQSAQEQARVAQTDPAKQNMAPMPYWEGDRYYRVGDKANDSQEMPKRKAPSLAPTAGDSSDPLGAFIDAGFVAPQASATDDTPPTPIKGIRIRDLPNGKIIGILPKGAELTVSDKDPKHPGWQKIKALKSGRPVGAVAGEPASEHAAWSWVFVDELDAVIDPNPLDTVVVLKKPHTVQAGEVIGQFGHYLRYTDAKVLKAKPTRPLLHLEVFAGPELKAFIDKSRARAKELPAAKTFLEISPGARLVTNVPEPDQTLPQSQGGLKLVPVGAASASRWIKVQPKAVATADSGAQGSLPVHGSHAHGSHHAPHQTLMNVGSPVWVEAALANTTITSVVKGWTKFPLSLANAKGPGADFRDVFRRAELDKLGPEKTAIDDQGHHWWYIELGAKDGSIRQGWVCEENPPLVRMCGPWDWPGFDLVDNSSFKPVDMLKRYIYASEQFLVGEEQSEFEQSALTVNAGGLITQLEKAIDANHDGKVTAQELQHAQETRWTAEALSHLVVRSETEWGGGLGKWEELSPLMKKLLWLWQAEIERIGKLQWWEQAAGIEGFPKEPNPWHFHPVGLVGNFVCNCHCINVEAFLKTYEAQHTSFETGAHPLDATSKENLRVFVQGILDYYKTYENGECNIQYIAYMLATARLETKKYHKDLKMFIYFEPTSENGSLQYFDKYDPILADTEKHRKRAISNGNTEKGDGYKYRGRGYVQVTWKNAYRAIGDKIGIDLVSNPDRMQEPAIAAWATVYGMETGLFTGKKLSDYIGAVKQDYYNARQIINGHDQAETIAGFAVRFKTLLESTTC